MHSKVQKWGNSLAVRIPKTFAAEMNLAENASVQIMVKEGVLTITPDNEQKWKLVEMLAGVTKDNIPEEWETGVAVGKEIW